MIKMAIGEWTLSGQEYSDGVFPYRYKDHVLTFDEYKLDDPDAGFYGLAVHKGNTKGGWPHLVIVQQFAPSSEQGFNPSCLLLPETERLFVGAGERLLCYDLKTFTLLWEDQTQIGFGDWSKEQGFVILSAELEIVVFDTSGQKLWGTFVEPPWEYAIVGDNVELDIMGREEVRCLKTGELV